MTFTFSGWHFLKLCFSKLPFHTRHPSTKILSSRQQPNGYVNSFSFASEENIDIESVIFFCMQISAFSCILFPLLGDRRVFAILFTSYCAPSVLQLNEPPALGKGYLSWLLSCYILFLCLYAKHLSSSGSSKHVRNLYSMSSEAEIRSWIASNN